MSRVKQRASIHSLARWPGKNGGRKSRRGSASRLASAAGELNEDADLLLAGAARSDARSQAGLLYDGRLPAAQRRSLAARLGRIAGNARLQRAVAGAPVSRIIQRFEGGEHLQAGDQAYAQALAEYIAQRLQDVPPRDRLAMKKGLEAQFGKTLRRISDRKEISYGAVTALSGDFYATAAEVARDTEGWVNNNDIDDLVKQFGAEQAAMNTGAVGEQYASSNFKNWWNSREYLALAEQNTAHFAGHTLSVYVENHRAALAKAREAYLEPDETKKEILWDQARFQNGFADHFLADSFCSGHMRVPRQEIANLFTGLGFSSKEAGMMVKIVHDYDNTHGVAVRNARGDQWTAFGDKLLRADLDPDKKKAYTVAITQGGAAVQTDKTGEDLLREAVKLSVLELFRVYEAGEELPAEFAALRLMPFVDWEQQSLRLEDVFNVSMPEKQRAESVGSTGLIGKLAGVGADEMDVLARNLPRLMNEFHAQWAERFRRSDQAGQGGELAEVPGELRAGLLSLGEHKQDPKQVAQAVSEILTKEKYLNDDEQKEIIGLLSSSDAAVQQLPAEARAACARRFDAKNFDPLLASLQKAYRTLPGTAQEAEINLLLAGRTNEQAEKAIIAILECMSADGRKQLIKKPDLVKWLKRDLTGERYRRFLSMLPSK